MSDGRLSRSAVVPPAVDRARTTARAPGTRRVGPASDRANAHGTTLSGTILAGLRHGPGTAGVPRARAEEDEG